MMLAVLISGTAQAQPIRSSVRVATYNAFLLSPAFRCSNVNAAECVVQSAGLSRSWAKSLAAAIVADRESIDVLVVNEAWDEDAKQALIQGLSGYYEVIIGDIDAPTIALQQQAVAGLPLELRARLPASFAGEDSGLMLFAKPEFSVLPLPRKSYLWGDDPGELISASGEVAFTRFTDCAIADCLAAKGAALVRLKHFPTERIFNLVLTHMQADDFDAGLIYSGVRRRQFQQIERMIRATLNPLDRYLRGDDMLVMAGDLNVPALSAAEPEFRSRFASPISFFTTTLAEAWSRTSDRRDRTPTNRNDKVKLDYILYSPPPPRRPGLVRPSGFRACVQHLLIPPRYRQMESDHHMVLADLSESFAYCSPATARVVPIPPVGENAYFIIRDDPSSGQASDLTRIATRGAMQWFRVEAPASATYTIGLDNPDLRIDIYLPEDLSVPQSRYNRTPATAKPPVLRSFYPDQFVLPPVFYIRVSGSDRRTTGDYALLIRRHNCSSRADACLLKPGSEAHAALSALNPAPNQIGEQDAAWFRYDVTGAPASGLPQRIGLTVAPVDRQRMEATLLDHSDPAGLLAPAAVTQGASSRFAGPATEGASGYLLVQQSQRSPQPTLLTAAMTSSLKILTVGRLVCQDETNPELGSDDVYTEFLVDGSLRRVPALGDVSFDCDEPAHARAWATPSGTSSISYADGIRVRVVELDGVTPNSVSAWSDIANPDGAPGTKTIQWKFGGGDYRLFYDVAWRANAPVADFP